MSRPGERLGSGAEAPQRQERSLPGCQGGFVDEGTVVCGLEWARFGHARLVGTRDASDRAPLSPRFREGVHALAVR